MASPLDELQIVDGEPHAAAAERGKQRQFDVVAHEVSPWVSSWIEYWAMVWKPWPHAAQTYS